MFRLHCCTSATSQGNTEPCHDDPGKRHAQAHRRHSHRPLARVSMILHTALCETWLRSWHQLSMWGVPLVKQGIDDVYRITSWATASHGTATAMSAPWLARATSRFTCA